MYEQARRNSSSSRQNRRKAEDNSPNKPKLTIELPSTSEYHAEELLKSGFSAYSSDRESPQESLSSEDYPDIESIRELLPSEDYPNSEDYPDIESIRESLREASTSKYTKVAMGEAKQAGAGEGLETSGLSDCTAIAILSNFDSQSKTYGEMALFHVAGSDVESPMNKSGAISVLQNIAKGEYTAVIISGVNSASDTAKSMFAEQKDIKNLLSGSSQKPEEHTGTYVSIDRYGHVKTN